jgi:NADPH-dependent curcumin reductase CurA
MKADKEVWIKCNLTAGKYFVYVAIDWYQRNTREFTLSAYYPEGKDVFFEIVPDEVGATFLDNVFINHA